MKNLKIGTANYMETIKPLYGPAPISTKEKIKMGAITMQTVLTIMIIVLGISTVIACIYKKISKTEDAKNIRLKVWFIALGIFVIIFIAVKLIIMYLNN